MSHPAMRLSTISRAGADVVHCGEDRFPVGGLDVASHDERDFSFDPRRDEPVVRDLFVLASLHAGEQDPEVGLVYAELALNGRSGQPDLASNTAVSDADPALDDQFLDLIGRVQVTVEEITDGSAGAGCLQGTEEGVGHAPQVRWRGACRDRSAVVGGGGLLCHGGCSLLCSLGCWEKMCIAKGLAC